MLLTPRSPTSPQSNTNSNNPLSLRLYKVLAANFDDEATKEALQTLAEIYYYEGVAPSSALPPTFGSECKVKSKGKGKEVLRNHSDEDDELEAGVEDEEGEEEGEDVEGGLQERKQVTEEEVATRCFAESVPGEVAAKARRSLRRDVESKLAESSRRFLIAFSEVDKVCCPFRFL